MAVNPVSGGQANNSQMAQRVLNSSGNKDISTRAIQDEINKSKKESNGNFEKAAADIMRKAAQNNVSAQQLIDAGLSEKDVYGYLNSQTATNKTSQNQSRASSSQTTSQSNTTSNTNKRSSTAVAASSMQANQQVVANAVTTAVSSHNAKATSAPLDPRAAATVVYGQGNASLSDAQLNTAIDQIVAKYPDAKNPEDWQKVGKELLSLAVQFNVSAKQVASLNRQGLSAHEIDTFLKAQGVTPELVEKPGANATPSQGANGQSGRPNAAAPYAPNLTSDQAQRIADKYIQVFGYEPSPAALRLYGYRLGGTYPQTMDQVINGIEKKPFESGDRVDMRRILEAGIDPDIYTSVGPSRLKSLDWHSILNSENPNLALRSSLSATLRNTVEQPEAYTTHGRGDRYVVAAAGNLVVRHDPMPNGTKVLHLSVVDDAGNAVDTGFPFSYKGLIDAAYMYGLNFDPGYASALNSIADQLEEKGIGYKPGELYPGRGSDHGVNLRDIAIGGTGAGYIPTMSHAVRQAETSSRFFGETDASAAVYYTSILGQANLEYRANAIDVDLTNASSVRREFQPFVDKNGATYNYLALAPGGGVASWFKTEQEARDRAQEFGGRVYDLREGSPDIVINRVVRPRQEAV